MSYDIRIDDEQGNTVLVEGGNHFRGGTFAVGGDPWANLNITYNYRPSFVKVFGEGGIRSLYEKTVGEVIPLLADAIAILGTERDEDYWKPTDGNAGAALADLLTICLLCPANGVLRGD